MARRWRLGDAWDGGDVVADPANGQMLISESQAANAGVDARDRVWMLDRSHLRLLDRMHFPDAAYFNAQPL